jgi:hypothetical protein
VDGDEGGGAVGKMQGLVITVETVGLFIAIALLPPAKPQRSPLVRYFAPGAPRPGQRTGGPAMVFSAGGDSVRKTAIVEVAALANFNRIRATVSQRQL